MSRLVDGVVRHRADRRERQEHRRHHAEVTNAVGDKSFFASYRRAVAGVPERDQEIRARTDAFPAQEGNEQVFAQYKHEHRKHEQVEIDEEL
jgi:hypothetical protein